MTDDAAAATDAESPADEILAGAVVAFAGRLRGEGVTVAPDATSTATEAVAVVGFQDETRIRDALRATLLTRADDFDAFDELFPSAWRRALLDATRAGVRAEAAVDDSAAATPPPAVDAVAEDRRDADPSHAGLESAAAARVTGDQSVIWGPAGRTDESTAGYSPMGSAPFDATAAFDDPPAPDVPQTIARLRRALATEPGRRRRPASDGRFRDSRRALRRGLATGGVPLVSPMREPASTTLRTLVLVDVSRSMLDALDPSVLLATVHGIVRSRQQCRASVVLFDADAQDVTDAFDAPTVSAVASNLADAAAVWGGGTRIGHALSFVRRSQPDAVDRRTVVLVVSDGLDVGDIDLLDAELAHLARRSRAILWLNPLAGAPGYEPTCRGIRTALPYVRGPFPFADVADLRALAEHLERRGVDGARPIGVG
ncbi:vWA domain-containing protein [Haloferacaceae archaeon DSL9]